MPPPMRSEIWKYFTLVNKDTAQCNICIKQYSRKGRTNTSLKTHLKFKHPEEYNCFLNCDIKKQEIEEYYEEDNVVTPIQQANKELSTEETFQYDKDNPNSVMIDKLIGEMIAVQDLPFHFVEGIGFRRLMQTIVPKYNLRGRSFFTDYVCKDLYDKVALEVKKIIKDFKYMAFTSDIWTDSSVNVSLLILTCHGITDNFERKSIILKCEIFDDRNAGDIIAEKYESMLIEWGICKDQVHCIIRDEGSNMKRAMTIIEFSDMDCTAYKLQLCVKSGLKSHQTMIEINQKLKKIANHFNHSTIAQKELSVIQERLNQPILTVFQDCATKWNHSFYMMERFLKIKDSLSIYNNNNNIPVILAEEWKIIEDCVHCLRPFEETTRELSNSNAFISSVIPLIHLLTKKLEEQLTRSDNSDVVKNLITTIKTNISAKFSDINNNFLFTISTLLDPRYKTKFFNEILIEEVESEVLRLVSINRDEIEPPSPKRSRTEDEEQPTTSKASRQTLQNELEDLLDSSDEEFTNIDNLDTNSKLKNLLKQYCKEKKIVVSQNPLDWWRTHGTNTYKEFSTLARRFLSPPPANVSSEQLFSAAGIIYKPSRNRLQAEKAAQLLFLKYNLPLIQFQY